MPDSSVSPITTQTGQLQPAHLDQAASIFYEAFRLKLHHLELFARTREQAMRVLKGSFRPDNAIFAFEQERLVGLVGLEHADGQRFLDINPAVLRSEFGRFGALWRTAWLQISHAYQRPGQGLMRIDSIAVEAGGRGKGVGTLLLNQAIEHARQLGCRAVMLEVVDTNPRARQLYERMGFYVHKEEWYGPITARAGLSGVAFMRKKLL